jgi:hypothetical protein
MTNLWFDYVFLRESLFAPLIFTCPLVVRSALTSSRLFKTSLAIVKEVSKTAI